MKLKKIISKYFESIFKGDKNAEQEMYQKITKKSLKGKKTQRIK